MAHNDSVLSGTFTSVFKLADIVPIHKNKPVNFLPKISKIFEKIFE